MSECIFSDETYSSTAIWILSLHSVSINLFFGTDLLFFCFRLFYLSTRFLRFLSFESFFTFHLISDFLFIILFEMLWMLFMVNKVKHMVCHGSHMSQITDELFLIHFFSVCPMKLRRHWSHVSWLTTLKRLVKTSIVPSINTDEKEKKKSNTGNCKVFYLTCKRNND